MPKLRDTPKTRMDRAFMAALRYGQAMRGETDKDTMRLMPKSTATYYLLTYQNTWGEHSLTATAIFAD